VLINYGQGILYGWPAFFASLAFLGILVALISDFASHFGCIALIKDVVTATTLLALGTSLPGLGPQKKTK